MKNAAHVQHRGSSQLKSMAHSEYAIKYAPSPERSYLVCPLVGPIKYHGTTKKQFKKSFINDPVVKYTISAEKDKGKVRQYKKENPDENKWFKGSPLKVKASYGTRVE